MEWVPDICSDRSPPIHHPPIHQSTNHIKREQSATSSPLLSVPQEIYGLEWPADDPSPRNVYESLIHPLHKKWDEVLTNKSISGGEGYSAQLQSQTEKYIEIIQDAVRRKEKQEIIENVKVCETGCNMGHSALTYLFGAEGLSEKIKVEYHGFSFPLNNHQMIAKEMKDIFELTDRFDILWGDSTKSLPYYVGVAEKNRDLNRCDVVIVDGGHSEDVAKKDIANMKSLANKEYHVLIVDDLACNAGYCMGPVKAWNQAKADGVITEEGCWGDGKDAGKMTAVRKGVRGFCWGKYNF